MNSKKTHHHISVANGYKISEGLKLTKYKWIKFTTNATKRYDNYMHQLVKLDKCSILLLNYLVDHCNYANNTVYNNVYERELFINFCTKNCAVKYYDDSVKKAFKKLVSACLLLQYRERGTYTINPKYYFHGDESQRRKILQELCSFAMKEKGSKGKQLRKALGIN